MNHFNVSKQGYDYTSDNQVMKMVKKALKDADLMDQIIIEERQEGFMVKPKNQSKEDKIKTFDALAGSAILVGDNVDDLIKMAKRDKGWRSNEEE